MISLTNELAPTYRARHPHGPSASFPYVPTYGIEYLQGANAPFSCFYDNTSTDANCCCCCCCCCQYKLSAGSRKELIVNTAGSTSSISSNIYLKELRGLSRGLMSLNNEWAPTYRAGHPHGPSESFLWVPTYGVEYPQSASAPFSCFYDNTSTDTNCCCCCCCCQYNFLLVAERNKLLILLAVPAVLAVIYT